MKVELEISIMASELAFAVGATFKGDDRLIKLICTDSREITENGVFFAFGSGESYVSDVLKTGLAVSSYNTSAMLVRSVEDAFLKLAEYYKSKLPNLQKTVAITGSVGKSSVKEYTYSLLNSKYKAHKTYANYNNKLGLPLSILSAPKDTEFLILEMGTNHPGEIASLSKCARPDVAIITSIGTSHIGNFGTRENIAKEKKEILSCKNGECPIIIPANEPLLSGLNNSVRIGKGGDVEFYTEKDNEDKNKLYFKTNNGHTAPIEFSCQVTHFASNLAFAVAAAIKCGMTISDIDNALSANFEFIVRQKYISINNFTLIDDSYNASLESYAAGFETASKLSKKASALIGDILELGSHSEKIHRKVGELCVKYKLDKIYPFGKYCSFVTEGAISAGFDKKRIHPNPDPTNHLLSASQIIENSDEGEVILIKGSHALHTEKVIECIKELSRR